MKRDPVKVQLFIENAGMGKSPQTAARAAGYSNPGREGRALMKIPAVLHAIKTIQLENRKNSALSRKDVMENLIDAFALARTLSDPQAMIRAMSEVNRMSGYYAPEKKIIELQEGAKRLEAEVEAFTKQELLEMLVKEEETPFVEAQKQEDGSFVVEEEAA
jgi:hypothetical protein